ncbi:subtilisin-like protease SBT3.9 [Curcuma longa]|uniref:subtilisin-like protease SBT3.9 n=1 Tax=Curcuma longa TaxID=136217 RepID=UPI003D9EFF6D
MYSKPLLPSFLCFLLALSSIQHIQGQPSTKLYIVYLGERKHNDPNHVTASHHDMLSSILGSKEGALSSIVYSYKHGFSGFAAMLTEYHADRIRELPEVISIKPSESVSLLTTRSWDYLGVGLDINTEHNQHLGLLQKANFGEDIIIGVVDSGIWPESRSFDDYGYGPNVGKITLLTRREGDLDPAEAASQALMISLPVLASSSAEESRSVRMGTRVNAPGVARCSMDAALGGDNGGGYALQGIPRFPRMKVWDPYPRLGVTRDASEEEILEARKSKFSSKSICWSRGQGRTEDGGSVHVASASVRREKKGWWRRHQGGEGKERFSCFTDQSLNSTNMEGKIVVCADSISSPGAVASSATVANRNFARVVNNLRQANAKGVIFARSPLGLFLDFPNFFCIFVDNDVLWQIKTYTASDTSPVAKVRPAYNIVGSRVISPRVAAFSSRWPSIRYPDLIKPDITAPGVNILAAMFDSYAFESGTSMSCPHVSGIVALLKNMHPKWSPAAIKSALVTTAYTTNAYGFPIEADGIPRKLADPFDYGGGHVDPNKALDPGLVYDVDPNDYFKFFNCTNDVSSCELVDSHLYHLNLPSVSISDLKTSVTINRTVTNVGDTNSVYLAVVQSPPGVDMLVEPSILEFNASKNTQTFVLTFKALGAVQGDFTFGSLTWTDGGNHTVRIPIAVRVIIEDFYSNTS